MEAESSPKPASAATELGLRERKKLETRKRLAKAALELTEREGFEAATVSAIAAAADVSPRTVFGYFPTKESIIFGGTEEFLDGLDSRLNGRPEGETVAEALRAWLLQVLAERDEKELDVAERRRRVIDAEPALRAYERLLLGRAETIIAEAVAGEIGRERGSLLPQMVGASTVAALESIGRSLKGCSQEEAAELVGGHVDDLTSFVAGGIGALTPRG